MTFLFAHFFKDMLAKPSTKCKNRAAAQESGRSTRSSCKRTLPRTRVPVHTSSKRPRNQRKLPEWLVQLRAPVCDVLPSEGSPLVAHVTAKSVLDEKQERWRVRHELYSKAKRPYSCITPPRSTNVEHLPYVASPDQLSDLEEPAALQESDLHPATQDERRASLPASME
jgi:hypothetical protein